MATDIPTIDANSRQLLTTGVHEQVPVSRPRSWRTHAAVLGLFVGLAILHTWPLATAPGTLSRNDNADTILNEWIIAWDAHQLAHDPLHLFDANIFYPEPNTLAFSEHMIVQAVMGAPLSWAGVSPVLVYNLLLLAGFALSGWAMYLVMLHWTGDPLAAVVAGALFAFNAQSFSRIPHLQALHVEFLPLAVAALDCLLAAPRVRYAVAFAALFTLQALTSNYLMVFTAFAMVAVIAVRPSDWWGARFRRVAGLLAFSAVLGGVALAPFIWPYYWAEQHQGLTRTLGEVALYSGSWRDYLSTPAIWHFRHWSHDVWASGGLTPLFPGVVATLLAGAAVATGTAFRDRRARAWLAIGALGFLVSFGLAVPGYEFLYRWFPPLQGIRAPVRMGWFTLAAISVLAGFGLAALRARWAGRAWVPAATLGLLAVAMLEVRVAPIPFTRAVLPPPVYDVLAAERRAVVAEFPMFPPNAFFRNAQYMLNSTRHWKPLVNGYSGFMPASYVAHWKATRSFPAHDALRALANIGVTHVVVHGSTAATDRVEALERLASGNGTTIYRLRWDRIGP